MKVSFGETVTGWASHCWDGLDVDGRLVSYAKAGHLPGRRELAQYWWYFQLPFLKAAGPRALPGWTSKVGEPLIQTATWRSTQQVAARCSNSYRNLAYQDRTASLRAEIVAKNSAYVPNRLSPGA
jgi:hypothetical protein